jgi:rRNA-processing protein FCF1
MMTASFMVDTNGYDYLVESEQIWSRTLAACESKKLQFLMTQVQIDQIRVMLLTEKRNKARNMLAIPLKFVKTSAFLFGFSKIGLAEYGPPEMIDAIRGDAHGDDLDSPLIGTALRESVVLVTADKRLRNKAERNGVSAIHPRDLLDVIMTLEE